jgi:hypothetical protein
MHPPGSPVMRVWMSTGCLEKWFSRGKQYINTFRSVEFFEGYPLVIHILDPHGALIEKRLGRNFDAGESSQAAIEPGNWFAAEHQGPGEFGSIVIVQRHPPRRDEADLDEMARYGAAQTKAWQLNTQKG